MGKQLQGKPNLKKRYFHNCDYFAIKILFAFCNVGEARYNRIGKNTTINITTKKKFCLRVHVVVKTLGSFAIVSYLARDDRF